jgi:hypothetical protein
MVNKYLCGTLAMRSLFTLGSALPNRALRLLVTLWRRFIAGNWLRPHGQCQVDSTCRCGADDLMGPKPPSGPIYLVVVGMRRLCVLFNHCRKRASYLYCGEQLFSRNRHWMSLLLVTWVENLGTHGTAIRVRYSHEKLFT